VPPSITGFIKTHATMEAVVKTWLRAGLVLAALAQLAVGLSGRAKVPPPPLLVGDMLSIPDLPLSTEHVTVLLAFRETCAHCVRVAPAWAEWMRTPRDGVDVITVSSDEEENARRFSQAHGFAAPVVSLAPMDLSRKSQLLARTPWAWIVGPDHRLLYQGHGGDLAAVDSVLASANRGLVQ